MTSPILLLHISGGVVGLLSGATAMAFRKGSRPHGVAGTVFFISMLTMSAAGTYLAFIKSEVSNVFGGSLTFYMVATAWMTARRRNGEASVFDWAALAAALGLTAALATLGIEAAISATGIKEGMPAAGYFVFGFVALLCVVGDVRILRGSISGRQRIARHLWRMCFAWFAASASLFMARPQLFPAFMSTTHILFLLGILPLILMIFWLIRIRFKNAYSGQSLSLKLADSVPQALKARTVSWPQTKTPSREAGRSRL